MSRNTKHPGFDFQVSIPAGELARMQRRLAYLETVTVQLLREHCRIKEWFTAAELEALGLAGLPASRNAIGALARREGWPCREVRGKGGARYEFHFSGLPRRPFEALLNRVLRPDIDVAMKQGGPEQVPAIPDPPPAITAQRATAPQWVLPLLRIVKGGGARTVKDAVALLAHRLPMGADCPTVEEAQDYLESMGIVAG